MVQTTRVPPAVRFRCARLFPAMTWVFAVSLFLLPGAAGAGTRIMLDGASPTDPSVPLIGMDVTEPAAGLTRLTFELAGFELDPVAIDGRLYQQINLDREGRLLEAGAPDLPHVCRSVIIPDDGRMDVRVLEATYREFGDIDVAPSKGSLLRDQDPASVPLSFGPAYEEDAWYPAELVTPREPYILRDYRGLVVDVNPVRYNPVTRTLRVYDRLVVEVVPAGPGGKNVQVLRTPAGPTKPVRSFVDIYENHFVNFVPPNSAADQGPGEMLVLAPDEFAPAMRDFVDWKNQRGIRATLVRLSAVGSTAADVLNYIRNFYLTHDLAFVLLVGDALQMPSPIAGYSGSDPLYSLISGNDSYPEVFVGRLSAETVQQVELQVRKFVEYERDPEAGASWYRKGVGIGSGGGEDIGDDGEADYQHIENIRTDLLGFTYTQVDSIYPIPGHPSSAAFVGAVVSAGRSLINYCGHGSTTAWTTTGFNTTHVAGLTNVDRLPWIFSVACSNGNYAATTCFAESWVRANQAGEPTGAVGIYASNIVMTWAPPMAAQDEAMDLLVSGQETTFGTLCYLGACLMIDEYPSYGSNEFLHWHIFGDPSLTVRSDTPQSLQALHARHIEPDARGLTVRVTGVVGALCALSRGGKFLGADLTDETGEAQIVLVGQLLAPEEITLTVTGFNRLPYVAEIAVRHEKYPPVIDVRPGSLEIFAAAGAVRTEPLALTHPGGGTSDLADEALTYRLATAESTAAAWLAVHPKSGELNVGETDLLYLTIDAGDLEAGAYTVDLILEAGAERIVVPVRLEVGASMAVGDHASQDETPGRLALEVARPNPTSGGNCVRFALPYPMSIDLAIHDTAGRRIRTLASGELSTGSHECLWDGRDREGRAVLGGVYFYRLSTPERVLTEKILLLK
ncbi:MAG: C25 family cysteine peptidase [Candidatus Eisenbacteria bacterium]